MNEYSQPTFYRFNTDSIKLVRYVISKVIEANNILDLGAGCGVIGIEVANALRAPNLTLLEIQDDYRVHLIKNIGYLLDKTNTEVCIDSFSLWKPIKKYDLIVSNPPYYLLGHGEPSKDERRHVARTFVRDGWQSLLHLIQDSLADDGKAYIVLKNDQKLVSLIKSLTDLKINLVKDSHLIFLEFSLDKE